MNRRALLKGLGAAVGALVVAPLVSLLPKVSPIVHVPGGMLPREGYHGFAIYRGRVFALRHDAPSTIFSWRKKQAIKRWGEEVGRLIEEEMRR